MINKKFVHRTYRAFNVSPKVLNLVASLEARSVQNSRCLMEEIIYDYKKENSLEVILVNSEEIEEHNEIVKRVTAMETLYAEFMLMLEESLKV